VQASHQPRIDLMVETVDRDEVRDETRQQVQGES
jgi:hypothetical protein